MRDSTSTAETRRVSIAPTDAWPEGITLSGFTHVDSYPPIASWSRGFRDFPVRRDELWASLPFFKKSVQQFWRIVRKHGLKSLKDCLTQWWRAGYAVQNHYVKNGEKETREYRIKRRQYDKLVRMLAELSHITLTKKAKTSLDFKKQMDEVTNMLYLYASGDVIRALKAFLTNSRLEEFRDLVFSMRKDLNIKPDLTASEIEWFRAT